MPHRDIWKLFHRFNELFIFIPTVLFVDSGHAALGLWVDHALYGTVLSQVIAMLAVLGERISHIGGPYRRLGPIGGLFKTIESIHGPCVLLFQLLFLVAKLLEPRMLNCLASRYTIIGVIN